jgi:signal transduction histidine kinase
MTFSFATPTDAQPTDIRALRNPRGRLGAERLIGWARLALSFACLLAIVIDPVETQGTEIAPIILGAYATFAATMVAISRWQSALLLRLQLAAHVIDVLVFIVVIIVTQGATSFFTALIFPVVAATVRWDWRAAMATGVILVLLSAVIGLLGWLSEAWAFRPYVVRSTSLLAIAALLSYLGASDARYRARLVALAEWPKGAAIELEALARDALQYAVSVHPARGAAMLVGDREEPWMLFAIRDASGFRAVRETAEHFAEPVDQALGGRPFLSMKPRDAGTGGEDGQPLTVAWRLGALREQRTAAIAPAVADRLGAQVVLAMPLDGVHSSGWLFVLDPFSPSPDDLPVAAVVGRQVATSMDQHLLLRDLNLMSAAEERARLSRDLHDGILQSLTGAALQLQALRATRADDPEMERELEAVADLLLDEQRDLRFYTMELRADSEQSGGLPFDAQVDGLSDRLRRVWGLEVKLDPGTLTFVPRALEKDAYRLLQEALVNAVRHGRATEANIDIRSSNGDIVLTVSDNGSGFSFAGEREWTQFSRGAGAPRSIAERLRALDGALIIRSAPSGATLEMRLPRAHAT